MHSGRFPKFSKGNKGAMQILLSDLSKQLNNMVEIIRALTNLVRKKLNTLLIIDIHVQDIVSYFVRDTVVSADQFEWESQLRFYWDSAKDDCCVKQCTGTFQYGYEYMGLNGRLVITPLTDRCYMTLTQALTFKLDGSPSGPAGTGKTETVKDLAKSLALACFVINCGDGLDYKAMGSTFAGLIQSGAWGCFDEFNRINIEVLSVVSAQLKSIQNALICNSNTVNIGTGSDLVIKRTHGFAISGVFITMNPGYAGRTELPDNLKVSFRPVTMVVPDLQKIAESMEGPISTKYHDDVTDEKDLHSLEEESGYKQACVIGAWPVLLHKKGNLLKKSLITAGFFNKAVGWDGLSLMLEKFGKDYSP